MEVKGAKAVQIAVSAYDTPQGMSIKTIVAVDQFGRIWEFSASKWKRLPDLPPWGLEEGAK